MDWFLDDGDIKLAHGDVIDVLRSLPAGVAQTCVTSPPFFGLRDYGVDGQIGLEATVEEYLARLVAVFGEVWRVLRDDGTCWIELGDSYAGSWGAQSRPEPINGVSATQIAAHPHQAQTGTIRTRGVKPKDLYGVPWMVAFALRDAGWYLRSDIVWSRPNPMPESVTDRPTKSHSYLFLLAKRPRYFYDADAIREPQTEATLARYEYGFNKVGKGIQPNGASHTKGQGADGGEIAPNTAGRNRRSVWTIPTEPFPEAHFATYPQALVRPCIQAGTSEHGECVECGAPWVREVERERVHANGDAPTPTWANDGERRLTASGRRNDVSTTVETTGWRASCSCRELSVMDDIGAVLPMPADTRPQTVLDPFIGSGTTALVARNHARRCIGIDLSAEYLAIAARRLQQLSLLGGPA